jgi:1-acyl-sn-glycerol-3-phosphate acyltransferase
LSIIRLWRQWRAAIRVAAFLALTACLIVLYPLAIAAGQGARRLVRRVWCRTTCWILNVRVRRTGQVFTACPSVIVANHVSYIDILVLGSVADGTFIAKSEVRGWPLFGFIASCAGTMFIRRHWRQALIQRNAIAARMRQGESFILFAEGTSSNGLEVRTFKTSLLSVTEPWVLDCPVAAQGATLTYGRLADGRLFDRSTCDLYAWYNDMPFTPHLRSLLHQDGCEIELRLHEPVLSWSVDSRKVLAAQLRAEIAAELAAARTRARTQEAPERTRRRRLARPASP